MKKFYLSLIIFSLIWGSCSEDLPSVPVKDNGNTEIPEEPELPEVIDFNRLKSLLEKINLDEPYFFRVKAALNAKDSVQAQAELLRYFRERNTLRSDVQHASVRPEDKEAYKGKAPANAVKQANDALGHLFLAHKSFDPIDYGTDIDWAKPHSDNEVLYQVHRMYWWIPMGQTYWSTQEEKYAKEWVAELKDWIRKNPCTRESATFRYAWRPLEISSRLTDQTALFNYFASSEHFTPEVLVEFLLSYYAQCNYMIQNFPYDNGNHLLFCGKASYIAGNFFPEFKEAENWRQTGTNLLKEQLDAQVFEDGVQYEFAPKYQAAAISEFLNAMDYAILNNRTEDFPQAYKDKVRKMIDVIINISMNISGKFDFPMFGDTPHVGSLNTSFRNWLKYYPDDEVMKFFANSTQGQVPAYTSTGHLDGGFYTLRDGWKMSNIMMAVTAHPATENDWHSHPDVGTFELSVDGVLFMPDAGFYKYEGDKETNEQRKLYRRSAVHKIMTLDNKNIKVSDVTRLRNTFEEALSVISFSNQSYPDLKVTRTIYFKKSPKCFVIVDEGKGNATGQIDVHYNFKEEADVQYNTENNLVYTNANVTTRQVMLQAFSKSHVLQLKQQKEYANISYKYGEQVEGEALSFETQKLPEETVQIVTVICPFKTTDGYPEVSLESISGSENTGDLLVKLKIGGKTCTFN